MRPSHSTSDYPLNPRRFLLPPLLGIAAVLGSLFAGCAHTDFSAYEGSPVYQGAGGSKKIIEGVDVWNFGTPPRRYRVIGIIDDTRGGGPAPMAFHLSALASKARRQGGDGVIILNQSNEQIGSFAGMGSTSSTTSGQVTGNQSQALFNAYSTTQNTGGVNMPLFRHVSSPHFSSHGKSGGFSRPACVGPPVQVI